MKKILLVWLPREAFCTFLSKPELTSTKWYGLASLMVVLLLLTMPVLAQSERTVSGEVKDNTGAGLPGVTVMVKGTTVGSATDLEGKYSLTVPAGQENATLVFSYVGYITQEVPIGNQAIINATLASDSKLLDEVVVVGYGTQSKRDVTGSVASVKMDDVRSLPVPDAGQALQGRAAGVQVTTSGAPGSNATIRVRGTSTINDSNPLVVIDGVPTDLPLNAINPDDIETMDILKDASAAAIYGSRGAAGVVLITTKRGVEGKGRLEFRAYTAVQQATNMVDMLNSAQFAELHNEIMANNGQLQNPAYADPATITTNTDWLGEYFRSAPQQNYSVSYAGGTEKSNFYASGTYTDQDGIVINNGYKRYTLTLNSDNKFINWFKLSNNLLLSHDKKTSGAIDIRNAMAALPVQPLRNPDGTWSGPEGQSSWFGDVRNPVGQALENSNTTLGYNVLGNISGEFTILPQLTFKTTVGIQAAFWDSRNWSPKYAWKPIANEFSTLFQQHNKSITKLWDNYLTYDASFGNHHLTVLAGTSAQDNRYDQINASRQDFISDAAQQLDNGTIDLPSGGNASDWALFSFLGRVNYNYNDRYLLTANLRRDGSSRFGANNRWGTFPSASAKWRISEEDFFGEVNWLSDLSLRAGYGVTGNQNIGNYAYASRLTVGQATFNNTVVNSVVPVVLPNANVRWEEVEQSNIGLDAAFLNGRISVTVDGYIKNTNDMLVPMNVPVTTGYSDIFVPSINFGKVRNRGLEFAVTSHNTTGPLEWSTNMNFSVNENEILNLNGDVPLYGGYGQVLRQKNGYPINSFYGFIMNGIFQNQEEVNNYALQQQGADLFNSTAPGDAKFLDINNDGVINDSDRSYIGNPNPRFTFAMNNTFAWKGFDFTVFLQGVQGNDIFNANRVFQEGMAVAQNQTTAVLSRWTETNPSNSMPRAVFNDPNKNTRVSTRFVEDGSYLRVKNVTLGYTLPQSIIGRAKISSARIYVSGQNLFTFTNYTGFDPEVGVSGVDLSVYPLSRTLSAGINVGF
ncbi:SusC/RagA family TonB-linked outer membrane protein [Pontibacter beigongshangensis]|uniref:SusC/RagA family TonB-linked outer membrane protein n=1 Tax=Pontibacter beigongshangensis TaxID=2574733 RepID=UPI00164FA2B5|nr:TonB-dependent receptor [Pontibacter beigongshangensis]